MIEKPIKRSLSASGIEETLSTKHSKIENEGSVNTNENSSQGLDIIEELSQDSDFIMIG